MRTTPTPNPRVDKPPSPTLTTLRTPPKPSLVSAPSPHIRSKQARSRIRFSVSEPKPAPPKPRSTTGAVSSRFCDKSRASRAFCSTTLPRWWVGAAGSFRKLGRDGLASLPVAALAGIATRAAPAGLPNPRHRPCLWPSTVASAGARGTSTEPRWVHQVTSGLTGGGEPGCFPTIADQAITHAAGGTASSGASRRSACSPRGDQPMHSALVAPSGRHRSERYVRPCAQEGLGLPISDRGRLTVKAAGRAPPREGLGRPIPDRVPGWDRC